MSPNGTKRKAQASPVGTRIPKHARSVDGGAHSPELTDDMDGVIATGVETEEKNLANAPVTIPVRANGALEEDSDDDEVDMDDMYDSSGQESQQWQEVISNVLPTVVSIRFCMPCSFDSEFADTSEATGFVVDAERGYILTNRHVVGAGPFWGYCVFDNHEEVDVYAVYRDPIHDFGILRFDPKAIKYMRLRALELRPDLAKVGLDIRVVGNDAGEKLCILSGIISRVDRNAPEYADGYSDFNTCYYQTNAAASGGSSGSPVVNIDGHAVALQAGGRVDGASTDYMLPLDRALRALKCIQAGKEVQRGDIQCQFLLKPFDECRRLGLSTEREKQVRAQFPNVNHMLIAEIVLPEGPSHGKLQEGDVLLEVNGKLVVDFIDLDSIFDDSVGSKIHVVVQRVGKEISLDIEVGDLHAITPDRFLTIAGSTFHNISYHQARLYCVPCRGVYLCEAASSFRLKSADTGLIIETVDGREVPNLDVFSKVMATIPDRARVVVTFRSLRDIHSLHTTIVNIDRHWSKKMELVVRNDKTGLWDFTSLAEPLPPAPVEPKKAAFIKLSHTPNPEVASLVHSLVQVTCVLPMKLDAFPKNRRWSIGVVIDAEKGLVIVSRAIVPFDLCDITITIAESVQLVGKVVFLHPLENYAVIQYDPSLAKGPVTSARLSSEPMYQGQSTYFIGLNRQGRLVHTNTSVTEVTAVTIPPNSAAPRYRAVNVDAITVDTALSDQCGSGILVANDGTVQAFWMTYMGEQAQQGGQRTDEEYHLGLAAKSVQGVVNTLREGKKPELRMLPVEWTAIPMSQARIMGVSEEYIDKVTEVNDTHHQLFMVDKRWMVSDAEKSGLEIGDILLTINGKVITRVSEFEVMYQASELDITVVRKRKELKLNVPTISADNSETQRAIWFAGAVLHRPHQAVRQQTSKLPSEVYISARSRGSPSCQYGLSPTNFITHVNERETKDLDSFLAAVNEIPNNTYFVIKAVTFDCIPWVCTIKKNDHYFPTVEWVKDETDVCGWKRISHAVDDKGESETVIQATATAEMDA